MRLGFISLSLFLLVLLFQVTHAQDLAVYQARYPQENLITLNKTNRYVINIVADTLQVTKYVEEQTMYLTGNDLRYSKDYIYYNSFSDIAELNAYTSLPNKKGKYQDIPVINFDYQDVVSGGVFYDDRKRIQFVYPQVQEGAITTLKYTEEYHDPRMLDMFYFNSYLPLLNAQIIVDFPEDVELAYQLLGRDTAGVQFEKKKVDGRWQYIWTASELPKYEFEDNAPDRSYFDPHLIFRIASAKLNGKQQNVLKTADDLYAWYSEFIGQVDSSQITDLDTLVQGIVKGAKTDAEKAQKVFEWVQANITYVAFEDGMGGFIPRNAVAVCNKKYGDCKDMANLLKTMLRLAGLRSNLAWIGTRDRPYTYEDVPTPIVDNHMITALWLDDSLLFLDATGSYTPFGMPSSMIQGKEAMIEQGPGHYVIRRVPIVNSSKNGWSDTTHLSVNDNDLVGQGHSHWNGFRKVRIEYDYYAEDRQDESLFMSDLLRRGSNKFKLNDYTTQGMKLPNSDLEIDYDFEVPGYVKAFGGKIFVNLNLDKHLRTSNIDIDKRKHGREFDYAFEEHNYTALDIPDGYSVDYLPETVSFDGDGFSFSIEYENLGNQVIYKKSIIMDRLLLEPAQFEKWNEFIDKLNKAYKETIVLTKKGD